MMENGRIETVVDIVALQGNVADFQSWQEQTSQDHCNNDIQCSTFSISMLDEVAKSRVDQLEEFATEMTEYIDTFHLGRH